MNSLIQLSLFDNLDNRPLPLIVADKWKFELIHILANEADAYYFNGRDWFLGLGGERSGWSKFDKSVLISTQLVQVKRKNQADRPEEFYLEADLYRIAINMRLMEKRPQLTEIREYLVQAGVKLDQYRRNPDLLLNDAVDSQIQHYRLEGKSDSFVEERILGKIANKAFRLALKNAVAEVLSELQYAIAQNSIYRGLWDRTAAQLKAEKGLKKTESLRDNQNPYALAYQRIAEMLAGEKLGEKEEIEFEEADEIIYEVATMIAKQAKQTSEMLGIDIATDKPMLPF